MPKTPRLREWRERAALSQTELAERSGTSRATIADLEAGNRGGQPKTVRRLAEALGIGPEDLYAEAKYPKDEAPPNLQPSFNGLLEEERRTGWEIAVSNARQLRAHGQERIEELLASWRESKDSEEDPAKRRSYLDEIGELLQEAYDVETALADALSGPQIANLWPEVIAADRFYIELWRLVEGAGLHIRIESSTRLTDEARQEQPSAHTIEEREAA